MRVVIARHRTKGPLGLGIWDRFDYECPCGCPTAPVYRGDINSGWLPAHLWRIGSFEVMEWKCCGATMWVGDLDPEMFLP